MGFPDVTKGTLAKLNAYFVLQQAEEQYNFKVENVKGLTGDDAMTAAGESLRAAYHHVPLAFAFEEPFVHVHPAT